MLLSISPAIGQYAAETNANRWELERKVTLKLRLKLDFYPKKIVKCEDCAMRLWITNSTFDKELWIDHLKHLVGMSNYIFLWQHWTPYFKSTSRSRIERNLVFAVYFVKYKTCTGQFPLKTKKALKGYPNKLFDHQNQPLQKIFFFVRFLTGS